MSQWSFHSCDSETQHTTCTQWTLWTLSYSTAKSFLVNLSRFFLLPPFESPFQFKFHERHAYLSLICSSSKVHLTWKIFSLLVSGRQKTLAAEGQFVLFVRVSLCCLFWGPNWNSPLEVLLFTSFSFLSSTPSLQIKTGWLQMVADNDFYCNT